MSARPDIATRAGRGGLAVLGAKIYFIVVGLAQQVILPRVLGLAGYGALSRVLAVANVVNNVIVTSSTQGVSRAVASAEDDRGALRRALQIHAVLAALAMIAFVGAAPAIAWLELAPHITWPLVAAGGVVGLYGLYAPLVGALNGRGQFQKQALLDVLFATLRTIGLVVGGLWLGALGAVLGFGAAALVIAPIALLFSGTGARAETELQAGAYLRGLGALALAQLATNLVMQSDITILARFLSASAPDAKSADEWVGVYRACQLFALLPYQLLVSLNQVLFPMLARARSEGDAERVKALTLRGVRLAMIAGGAITAVVLALPGSLLRFAYDANVAARGASALRVLAAGQGLFALLGVATTILAGLGHERRSARVTLAALSVSVISCVLLIPRAPFGAPELETSAACVTAAMVLAFAFAWHQVRAVAGVFAPWRTGARVLGALTALTLAGGRVPVLGRALTPLAAIGAIALYLGLLGVSGELRRADLAGLARLARR